MNREVEWREEEEKYNVKVIYMEGELLRTIKALLVEENESELIILRRFRRIRIPWRNVERIEHMLEKEYDGNGENDYEEMW